MQDIGTRWPGILLLSLLLTVFCVPLSYVPARAGSGDGSVSAVLAYAHQHQLQFGKDIVYTYGPAGFLLHPYWNGHWPWLSMSCALFLGLVVSLGTCLLASRLSWGIRACFLAAFVVISANINSGPDLLVYIGVFCWGVLAWTETGPRLPLILLFLVALLSLGALEKVSLMYTALLTIGLVCNNFVLLGKPKLAFAVLGTFGISFLAGWIGLGQGIGNLPAFLLQSSRVTSGYDQTMGIELPGNVLALASVTVLACAGLVGMRSWSAFGAERHARLRTFLLLTWLMLLLFITWKHGMLRADSSHLEYFVGFVPLLVLGVQRLKTAHATMETSTRGLAAICCLLLLLLVQSAMFPGFLRNYFRRPARTFSRNLASLSHPAEYWQERNREIEDEVRRAALPKIAALVQQEPVDMFGVAQTHPIFNSLNYHPRPVFQSYLTFNAPLMKLNADFYNNTNAPEYVVFRLEGLDKRFPALDDAWTLRHLLLNYEVITEEKEFLLLRKTSNRLAQLMETESGAVSADQPIHIPSRGELLWFEAKLHPTLLGRLRAFLYKPAPTFLRIEFESGEIRSFQAPASMLAAGFVVSPQLTNNSSFANLSPSNICSKGVACSIHVAGAPGLYWETSIPFKLSHIVAGQDEPARFSFLSR